jgi:hypothetical protein
MSKKEVIKFDPAIPAQFSKWFGAPPGFTNDDLQIHGEIVCALVHEVHPQDSFERMFIGDLAYLLCERLAWRRCRANRIRQAHHEKFERLEREVLLDAERRKEEVRKGPPPDPLAESLARWSAKSQTELAAERELREIETNKRLAAIDADTGKKLAELQKAKDGPIDEAACFDQWIDDVERIEKLSTEVDRKIINTLKKSRPASNGFGATTPSGDRRGYRRGVRRRAGAGARRSSPSGRIGVQRRGEQRVDPANNQVERRRASRTGLVADRC